MELLSILVEIDSLYYYASHRGGLGRVLEFKPALAAGWGGLNPVTRQVITFD